MSDLGWADKQLPTGVTRQDACIWIQEGDGTWSTSCGEIFEFFADGPRENKAHFCIFCGGVLLLDYSKGAEDD